MDPVGVGASCGSFGELLQGTLPDGDGFLVTLPIDLHSYASFDASASSGGLQVLPAQKEKARRLAVLMLARHDRPPAGRLEVRSDIPVGKGLASSTADLVAVYGAIASRLGLSPCIAELQWLLRRIEPSDGVMHRGIVAFRHRKARLHSVLGPTPALSLLCVDEGGMVDTIAFNRLSRAHDRNRRAEYASLLRELRRHLHDGNLAGVGRIATRSAELNQLVNPKRSFHHLLAIAKTTRALGVVTAHSGTCHALMFDRREAAAGDRLRTAACLLETLGLSSTTYMTLAE